MGDTAGSSSPLPSSTPINLRDLCLRAPRIAGASFDRERASVIIADADTRFVIDLPARIRGRLVVSLPELVELEIERAIEQHEVLDR